MTRRPPAFPAPAAACLAALAAWVSAGALTVAGAGPTAPRVGLLPAGSWLAVLVAVALLLCLAFRPSGRTLAPLAVSALVLAPWLPVPVPDAALAWLGHLRTWMWIAIGVALAAPWLERAGTALEVARDPRRAPWLAGAITLSASLAAAWQVFPRLPGGDEPHYLVITQSLLTDHDLKIENNHQRGDYRAYFHGDLPKPDYLRRGKDGEIYSIHAPGLPALVAPAFALFGYPGVIVMLALVTACGAAMAWVAAWRVTRQAGASWFGWAAVALSVPFFFHTFVVFPDGPGAALVMAAVLVALGGAESSERTLVGAGTALALLPWLHTRFALAAGMLGLVLAARQLGSPRFFRRIGKMSAAPALSAALWFWFFYAVYGTPNPAAPYGGYTQSGAANLPRGISGLLFDQQFGVLPNAPVFVCAALGFVPLARRVPRLAVELSLVILPYALAVASYQMWWAGYSSPARFIVPVILTLSIPAAAWFASAGRAARIYGLSALLLSVLIVGAMTFVDRGILLYNTREAASARWLAWLSPVVNLTTGLPSLFQNTPGMAAGQAGVWILSLAAVAWIVSIVDRRGVSAQQLTASLGMTASLAGMAALAIVWRSNRAAPVTPSTGAIQLLSRYDPERTQTGLRYSPLQFISAADLPAMIPVADVAPASRPANQPVVLLARPPAGSYEVEATITGAGGGRVSATVDREFGPLWAWDLEGVRGTWRATLTLPVTVAGLRIDADPAARRAIDRLTIRARRVLGSSERLTDVEPIHATRVGPALLFLLDGHAYTERAGTWIAGGARATFVIAPDEAHESRSVRLFVRNYAAENDVVFASGGWRQETKLKPREERQFDLPLETGRPAVLLSVACTAGARPSEAEPGNSDTRLLGVWIELR